MTAIATPFHKHPGRKLSAKLGVVLGGIVAAIATAIPAYGAERISFNYAPFGQFNLPIASLETFAKQGKIDRDFAYYAKFIPPQELASLRDLLQRRFDVTPTAVSQFTYSLVGETVMHRLGNDFQTDTRDNGFKALSVAFFETYINNQPDYRSYLNATYAESISQPPITLNLVRSFASTNARLNKK